MSRDGKPHELLEIPDGFYLIGCLEDKENANVLKWLGASVGGVEKITHIAPPDDNNEIVEETVVQEPPARKCPRAPEVQDEALCV